MVKHVILWKLKDELAGEEKEQVKAGIKEGLEGLDRKSTRLNSSHKTESRMPSSA